MIPVEKEPEEFRDLPLERCCFCKSPTDYWYTKLDVAVCPSCAQTRKPEEVSTKQQWCDSERFYVDKMWGVI